MVYLYSPAQNRVINFYNQQSADSYISAMGGVYIILDHYPSDQERIEYFTEYYS